MLHWILLLCVSAGKSVFNFVHNNLGKEIFELKAESKWGTSFYKNLSYDLSVHLPDIKGFSVTNLKYMRRFYELFPDVGSISPQLVDEFETELIFTIYNIPLSKI